MEFETADKMSKAAQEFGNELKKMRDMLSAAHKKFHETLNPLIDDEDADLSIEFLPMAMMPCATHGLVSGLLDAAIKDIEVKIMKARLEWKRNNDPGSITAAELREFAELALGLPKEKSDNPLPEDHKTDWDAILRGKLN